MSRTSPVLSRQAPSGPSANSHRSWAAKPYDPLFNGWIHVVDTEDLIDDPCFDDFGGHTENDASGFVLCQDKPARGFDGARSVGAVVAHARKHRCDTQRIGIGGNRFHGDIDVGKIAIDAPAGCV